jgi:hypothetical protein
VKRLRDLNQYRDRKWERMMGGEGDDRGGCFRVPVKPGVELAVIAASGEGWDHVSVSTPHRCPSWSEMEYVKRLFFNDNEVAMQLHVPPTDHISVHPHCLHIWRPHDAEIPLPPKGMVA